jgi:hypothetical protein
MGSVFGGLAREAGLRASRVLHRHVDHSKDFIVHMLAHEEASDLPSSGTAQFTL